MKLKLPISRIRHFMSIAGRLDDRPAGYVANLITTLELERHCLPSVEFDLLDILAVIY